MPLLDRIIALSVLLVLCAIRSLIVRAMQRRADRDTIASIAQWRESLLQRATADSSTNEPANCPHEPVGVIDAASSLCAREAQLSAVSLLLDDAAVYEPFVPHTGGSQLSSLAAAYSWNANVVFGALLALNSVMAVYSSNSDLCYLNVPVQIAGDGLVIRDVYVFTLMHTLQAADPAPQRPLSPVATHPLARVPHRLPGPPARSFGVKVGVTVGVTLIVTVGVTVGVTDR